MSYSIFLLNRMSASSNGTAQSKIQSALQFTQAASHKWDTTQSKDFLPKRHHPLMELNRRPNQGSASSLKSYSMTLKNASNCYVNFGNPYALSQISRSVFPYYMEESQSSPCKQRKKKGKINITNLIREGHNSHERNTSLGCNFIQNEDPPINEYLSFQLSRQINTGLYEVKVLAQEIKNIKREKQKLMEDKGSYKPRNRIRIKNTCSGRGSKHHPNDRMKIK